MQHVYPYICFCQGDGRLQGCQGAFEAQKHRTHRQILYLERTSRSLRSHLAQNRPKLFQNTTPVTNPSFEVTWRQVPSLENTAPAHKSDVPKPENTAPVYKSETLRLENPAPVHEYEFRGHLPRGSAVTWTLDNTAPLHKFKSRGNYESTSKPRQSHFEATRLEINCSKLFEGTSRPLRRNFETF